jgi:hypothetical protein
VGFFKVAKCDLKAWPTSQISTDGLHGTRRNHGRHGAQQPAGYSDERDRRQVMSFGHSKNRCQSLVAIKKRRDRVGVEDHFQSSGLIFSNSWSRVDWTSAPAPFGALPNTACQPWMVRDPFRSASSRSSMARTKKSRMLVPLVAARAFACLSSVSGMSKVVFTKGTLQQYLRFCRDETDSPSRRGCDCKILQSYRIQNPESQAKGLCPGAGRLIEFIFYDTTLESTFLRIRTMR